MKRRLDTNPELVQEEDEIDEESSNDSDLSFRTFSPNYVISTLSSSQSNQNNTISVRSKRQKEEEKYRTTEVVTIYHKYENAPRSNKHKQFFSHTKHKNSYYLGTYDLKLKNETNENDLKFFDKDLIINKLLKREGRISWVGVGDVYIEVNSPENDCNIKYEFEKDKIIKALSELEKNKCIILVFNKLNLKSVSVDIYLLSKLAFSLNEHSPSDSFNAKNSRNIEILMNYFYDIPLSNNGKIILKLVKAIILI